MPSGEAYMSFALSSADEVMKEMSDRTMPGFPLKTCDNDIGCLTSAMKVTVTPKAGSSGIMASNSRATDLLNPDKDPMKSRICTSANSTQCGSKLDLVWYTVYTTIRKQEDFVMTVSGQDLQYQGKLSVAKISLCYGVSYRFHQTPPCPGCRNQPSPKLQGSTCASKKAFKVKECRLVPKHGDLGEKIGGTRRRREPAKAPTKAPTNQVVWSKNCAPHIMDALQNAAAQRV